MRPGMGLGAVLAQRREDGVITPIAYASRTLQQHKRNYGITELEALGVVWAVKHFRHYLYGSSCDVYTDHEALKALLNTPHPSGKLARWGLALQELDLRIHYRPGKQNANADALSQVPLQSNEETIPVVVVAAVLGEETTEELAAEAELDVKSRQRQDPVLAQIISYLESGVLPEDEGKARELVLMKDLYELREGILYDVEKDKTLKFIPSSRDRRSISAEAHSGTFGGHLREAKIHSQLSKHYWWPKMRSDVAA